MGEHSRRSGRGFRPDCAQPWVVQLQLACHHVPSCHGTKVLGKKSAQIFVGLGTPHLAGMKLLPAKQRDAILQRRHTRKSEGQSSIINRAELLR